MRFLLRPAVPALVLAALVACGPPPKPVGSSGSSSSSARMPTTGAPSAPGPVDPNAPLPANHPPMGGVGAAGGTGAAPAAQDGVEHRWDGVVRLRGALAQLGEGHLFVSIKPEGVRMPSYSTRLPLAGATPDGADLLLPFELTEGNRMGGLVDGVDAYVLEAYFDPDGYVETKEGQVRASTPVEIDETGVELVLEG